MIESETKPWYIGCACDRNYVEHTAVMLTSLDLNGEVPEAIVTVVTFDLEEQDFDVLRAGAGRLAGRMRFLQVSDEMLAGVDTSRWPKEYPAPIIGRLFLPAVINEPNARLITLDSDMIVNVSLRPLFELNMGTDYVAACHDVPRKHDMFYFNSGLMVIDVDKYKYFNIAQRAMDWLSGDGATSQWPDQDALNLMVGDLWYSLDYRWNMHCSPVRALVAEDYDHAFIAHYAAVKPWNDLRHIGRPLYTRYLDLFRQRWNIYHHIQQQTDAAFIAMAHEILLGFEPMLDDIYSQLSGLSADGILRSLTSSLTFEATTLLSIKLNVPFPSDTFAGFPRSKHRLWAAERLPVTTATRPLLAAATSWRELLSLLLTDRRFLQSVGLTRSLGLVNLVMERSEMLHTQSGT